MADPAGQPGLDHWELAERFGLVLEGYQRKERDDQQRIAQLRDSKWVAGFQKVCWAKDRFPLSLPDFEMLGPLQGGTEDSYGAYKHSSELPPWPPAGAESATPHGWLGVM